MARSYDAIKKQIARLEAQAKALESARDSKKARAVNRVKALMKKLGVSSEDLSAGSITAGDVVVTNGTVTGATTCVGPVCTITVTATAEGVVSIAKSAAWSVNDLAGNAATVYTAGDLSVTYDITAPSFWLGQAATQADPTTGAVVRFSLTSGESLDASSVTAADFTTAKRIAAAVNDYLGTKCAEPLDPSTVQLSIPAEFKGNAVALLTEIEQLQIEPVAQSAANQRAGRCGRGGCAGWRPGCARWRSGTVVGPRRW